MHLGVNINVIEMNDFDKSLTIKIEGNQYFISYEVAKNLLVKSI